MAQSLKVADAPATEAQSRAPTLFYSFSILLLLSTGAMIAFVDRTSISTVLAYKPFIHQFALSSVGRGWISSAFFWSYAVIQMPMGWIVDRYGVKRPYTICFAIWCIATAATGVVSALVGVVLIRLFIGVSESIVMPASYRWMRDNFNENLNGTAVGIFSLGNKLGPAIGAPIASWLIINHSWRLMFVLTGVVGMLWLLPWMFFVKNDLPKGAEIAAVRRRASTVPFSNIIRSPVVWGAMISSFCHAYFTFYCMTWMPSYLVEQRGLSLEQSGLYTFFSFAGIALVSVIAGGTADALIARGWNAVPVRKAFVLAGYVGASTVVLGAQAESLNVALFWNVCSLSFLGLETANNLALCRLTLIPRAAVGLVTGVQQVASSLAGGIAASLSGWLLHISGSYYLPMQVIFVFMLIGAVSTWILLRPEWAPKVIVENSAI